MNYNERVRAMAEKMFSEFKTIPAVGIAGADHVAVEKIFMPLARIAVAEMADLAETFYHREALREGWGLNEIDGVVKHELKEQGLIPSAQEGGNDGEEK